MPASQAGRRRFDSGRPLQRPSGVTADAVAPDVIARLPDWHSVERPRPPRDTLTPRSVPTLPSWNAHLLAGRRPRRVDWPVTTQMLPSARHHGRAAGPSTREGGPTVLPTIGRWEMGFWRSEPGRAAFPCAGRSTMSAPSRLSWARDGRAAHGLGVASSFQVHIGHPATRSPWPARNCASVPDEGEGARPPVIGELAAEVCRTDQVGRHDA